MSVFSEMIAEYIESTRDFPDRPRATDANGAFHILKVCVATARETLIEEVEKSGVLEPEELLAAMASIAVVVELIVEDLRLTAHAEEARRVESN